VNHARSHLPQVNALEPCLSANAQQPMHLTPKRDVHRLSLAFAGDILASGVAGWPHIQLVL